MQISDVKGAYLKSYIDTDFYIMLPTIHKDDPLKFVKLVKSIYELKLVKSIYEVKQAGYL